MSTAGIIALLIGVVVVLGAVMFVTTARRSDVRGAGALSGETRRRDDAARRARERAEAEATRDLTNADEATATGTTLARPASVAAVPWSPPDPEAIGVSRRQFFNRATVSLMSASIGAFAA